jgi:hypothetical protein
MSPIRRRLIITLATLLLVAVVPVAVMAAGGTFTDDDTSIFEADIEWMAANGITSGCGTGLYCPDDNVTRGQMAAFMKRLATSKVVDAATAVTADHATTADSATTATSADTAATAATADLATNSNALGGKGVSGFQPALFDFQGNQDVTVNAIGAHVIATGEVTTAGPHLCFIGQFSQADILVRASGYTSGVGAGETASLYLTAGGVEIEGTRRVISADDGTFATEWLYSSIGGAETLTLSAFEGGTDQYSVVNAQISVEVLQDTRCEGFIIIFPGNPDTSEDDPQF